jgi:integrase
MAKRLPNGISQRHRRSCRARSGGRCNCKPTYQAQVYSAREDKRVSKTFDALADARTWRHDMLVAVRQGKVKPGRARSLNEAAKEWLVGARAGTVRNRSGDRYKPSAIRGYEQALRDRLIPELGGAKLNEIRRSDVQRLVNGMLGEGVSASTIRNALMPLRAIYRQAMAMDEVSVNPVSGVRLPAVRGKRERIAAPDEAQALIGVLSESDRAIWATAIYAGLRLGELQALRIEDVDLAAGRIAVKRSWDPKEGPIAPKSRAGRRTVPVPAVLRDYLIEHKLQLGRHEGLLFGPDGEKPFQSTSITKRARRVWKKAKLAPIGLHESRHTYASLMIAAGVNAKTLSVFMGHASITITLDRYGHLFPGSEDEAAGMLDAYLEQTSSKARLPAASDSG